MQWFLLSSAAQSVNLFLEGVQKTAGVGTVHLGVVELEGDRQDSPKAFLTVAAPVEERIVEYAAVQVYHTIDLIRDQG